MWTGQGVEGQISPIHDTPSVATLTHINTRFRAHIFVCQGHFPSVCGRGRAGRVQPWVR